MHGRLWLADSAGEQKRDAVPVPFAKLCSPFSAPPAFHHLSAPFPAVPTASPPGLTGLPRPHVRRISHPLHLWRRFPGAFTAGPVVNGLSGLPRLLPVTGLMDGPLPSGSACAATRLPATPNGSGGGRLIRFPPWAARAWALTQPGTATRLPP